MNGFWIAAAVLAAIAGLAVLVPLARRRGAAGEPTVDVRSAENVTAYRAGVAELETARAGGSLGEAEFAAARLELDRRVLAETEARSAPGAADRRGTGVLLGCAVALPLLAVLLYGQLGAGNELALRELIARLDQDMSDEERDALTGRMVPLLEAQARRRDPHGDYRYLLARLYTAEERYPQAAAMYSELVELYPQDAALIAQSAQALYLAGGRKLTPAVQSLIDRAFAIDPSQVTLLGLVGMDRFQAGDYRGAVDVWQKLLDNLPSDAPDASIIRDGIAMARARLGETPAESASRPALAAHTQEPGGAAAERADPAGDTSTSRDATSTAGPSLQVSVSVAPGLELRPGDTVFVFARAVNGPPMPLAVARFPAAELPRKVELNDAMAMAPGMKLSSFPKVTVVARVSRQGGVAAQPGDLEGGGETVTLSSGSQSLSITIDRTI